MSPPATECRSEELHTLPAPDSTCRAAVVLPARNEEGGLARTLDALRLQVAEDGSALKFDLYEVILLLNNCTDSSCTIARQYSLNHPEFRLRVAYCQFPPPQAHVGTARSMLMDCAYSRLETLDCGPSQNIRAILSTDADTLVAPDWIISNFLELEKGADAVGGVIELMPGELDSLGHETRSAYLADRAYQEQVARLEAALDPDPADPWPRHLQHFGASLACTTEVYRRSGGMPPVRPLEDIAFVDALRKVGARFRHSPSVRIYTSARLDGRTEVGLSGQLRLWQREGSEGKPQMVDSAEWLNHRFRTLAALRQLNQTTRPDFSAFPESWRERLADLYAAKHHAARFLELLDCDALIEEMFNQRADRPERRGEIHRVIHMLKELNAALTSPQVFALEHQA